MKTVYRPNILLRLTPCRDRDKLELLLARLPGLDGGGMLIRIRTMEGAEALARKIAAAGFACRHVGPGQTQAERLRAEAWFKSEAEAILVVAEPVRLPKRPDARRLFAMNLPPSLPEAIRDIGAIGRDGLMASADFFASETDRKSRLAVLAEADEALPSAKRRRAELAREDIVQAVAWIEHQGCAWEALCRELGSPIPGPCGNCGWCLGRRTGLLPTTP